MAKIAVPIAEPNESFEAYRHRWPTELDHFPDCVIRQWPYEVDEVAQALGEIEDLSEWTFERVHFSNDQIMTIRHYLYDEKLMFGKAEKWFGPGRHHAPAFLDFMKERGTYPVPIIVAVDAEDRVHPYLAYHRGETELMCAPYHLIEGNRRWALLRQMIQAQHPNLLEQHQVWLLKFSKRE